MKHSVHFSVSKIGLTNREFLSFNNPSIIQVVSFCVSLCVTPCIVIINGHYPSKNDSSPQKTLIPKLIVSQIPMLNNGFLFGRTINSKPPRNINFIPLCQTVYLTSSSSFSSSSSSPPPLPPSLILRFTFKFEIITFLFFSFPPPQFFFFSSSSFSSSS
jgi:hypothetical protein